MGAAVVPIGGTIGILGGGQLGRMMAIAGREMGLHTVIWDTSSGGPAGEAADEEMVAEYHDAEMLQEFSNRVERVTYEFENVEVEVASALSRHHEVFPSPHILHMSQNRLREKEGARHFGLETTPFFQVTSASDLQEAMASIGMPGILKTAEGGYDGKGQWRIESREDGNEAYRELGGADRELIYERMVPFTHEVSVIVARSAEGRTETFPVTENYHRNGILDLSIVPAEVPTRVIEACIEKARIMAEGLHLVGVMALEFFVREDGMVLFNEMAPRPHNSGHWTIDAASVSQFALHMRAVAGYDIEPPQLLCPAVMVNLLGDLFLDGWEALPAVLAIPGVRLHWYGKKEMRPGRKVGHLTILDDSRTNALKKARLAIERLGGVWTYGT